MFVCFLHYKRGKISYFISHTEIYTLIFSFFICLIPYNNEGRALSMCPPLAINRGRVRVQRNSVYSK